MFKVCIISCGMIANSAHIPAYKMFSDDYKIVAVCDTNENAAKETAQRHGILNYYTDAKKMLDEQKPDLVSVCVPNAFHKEYTIMALNSGANVLCEKPLAVTYKDAVEMFDIAKKNNKILMACQSMRFTPDRIAAKKYIEKMGADDIYYGEFSRIRRRGIPFWGAFHIKKVSCGGAFLDIGVHMLDELVYLMGNKKVKSVRAVTGKNHKHEIGSLEKSGALTGKVDIARKFNPDEMDVEDFSAGIITFENGAVVNFKVAWAANLPEETSIKFSATRWGMELPCAKVYQGADNEENLEVEKCPYDSVFPGHIYILDNLRKALKGEEELIVKSEETINVSAIIDLFYKSAQLKREVFMEEIL
ncbi:MAG: Gfo/Idh/MocA family oxidoreductase [Ruminococcaceae bacterium]|nr:Gfo/Idh/MocA family oxidoreductase [Oscillospiraceae bacterium]